MSRRQDRLPCSRPQGPDQRVARNHPSVVYFLPWPLDGSPKSPSFTEGRTEALRQTGFGPRSGRHRLWNLRLVLKRRERESKAEFLKSSQAICIEQRHSDKEALHTPPRWEGCGSPQGLLFPALKHNSCLVSLPSLTLPRPQQTQLLKEVSQACRRKRGQDAAPRKTQK